MKLLTREVFAREVFARSRGRCVICGASAVDVHHILEQMRRASPDYSAAGV